MKTVLFVPGFYENIDSRDYRSVLKAIEEKGYKAKFIDINWNRTTLNEWVAELEKTYKNFNSKDIILAGFSLGAVTALTVSSNKNPNSLWLFSLSPYFDDDVRLISPDKQTQKVIGQRRLDAFRKLNVRIIAKNLKCPVLLFCGDEERKKWPDIGVRADKMNKVLKDIKLINIPKVGHNIEAPEYIGAIEKVI
ncbi:hypothetical protein A3F64_01390 [Candidatus Saccharibacteria bacterium RIFCSPHIGHO2_12_FULL_42_8]|nr:MAG: hypothetical protein A3F64_01390 [Candidatus Saccharibacteria bacterium RIFCSPHIGHO2_12_FULL_42_8]